MDTEKVREYCLKKNNVTESFPFNDETLVFKIFGKMFCLLNLVYPYSVNLKCEPEKAVKLREEFEEIKPGFHMNKKHWNTVDLTGELQEDFIKNLIDNSYNLVVSKLPKSKIKRTDRK